MARKKGRKKEKKRNQVGGEKSPSGADISNAINNPLYDSAYAFQNGASPSEPGDFELRDVSNYAVHPPHYQSINDETLPLLTATPWSQTSWRQRLAYYIYTSLVQTIAFLRRRGVSIILIATLIFFAWEYAALNFREVTLFLQLNDPLEFLEVILLMVDNGVLNLAPFIFQMLFQQFVGTQLIADPINPYCGDPRFLSEGIVFHGKIIETGRHIRFSADPFGFCPNGTTPMTPSLIQNSTASIFGLPTAEGNPRLRFGLAIAFWTTVITGMGSFFTNPRHAEAQRQFLTGLTSLIRTILLMPFQIVGTAIRYTFGFLSEDLNNWLLRTWQRLTFSMSNTYGTNARNAVISTGHLLEDLHLFGIPAGSSSFDNQEAVLRTLQLRLSDGSMYPGGDLLASLFYSAQLSVNNAAHNGKLGEEAFNFLGPDTQTKVLKATNRLMHAFKTSRSQSHEPPEAVALEGEILREIQKISRDLQQHQQNLTRQTRAQIEFFVNALHQQGLHSLNGYWQRMLDLIVKNFSNLRLKPLSGDKAEKQKLLDSFRQFLLEQYPVLYSILLKDGFQKIVNTIFHIRRPSAFYPRYLQYLQALYQLDAPKLNFANTINAIHAQLAYLYYPRRLDINATPIKTVKVNPKSGVDLPSPPKESTSEVRENPCYESGGDSLLTLGVSNAAYGMITDFDPTWSSYDTRLTADPDDMYAEATFDGPRTAHPYRQADASEGDFYGYPAPPDPENDFYGITGFNVFSNLSSGEYLDIFRQIAEEVHHDDPKTPVTFYFDGPPTGATDTDDGGFGFDANEAYPVQRVVVKLTETSPGTLSITAHTTRSSAAASADPLVSGKTTTTTDDSGTTSTYELRNSDETFTLILQHLKHKTPDSALVADKTHESAAGDTILPAAAQPAQPSRSVKRPTQGIPLNQDAGYHSRSLLGIFFSTDNVGKYNILWQLATRKCDAATIIDQDLLLKIRRRIPEMSQMHFERDTFLGLILNLCTVRSKQLFAANLSEQNWILGVRLARFFKTNVVAFDAEFAQTRTLELAQEHATIRSSNNPTNLQEIINTLCEGPHLYNMLSLLINPEASNHELRPKVLAALDACIRQLIKNGVTHVTSSSIGHQKQAVKLQTYGLTVTSLPHDGHCLYNAVALYMGETAQQLRESVADYLQIPGNFERFKGFIAGETTNLTADAYVAAIRAGTVWAGEVEIRVLMEIYNRPIIVVGPDANIIKEHSSDDQPEDQSIMVLYNGRTHYDGLTADGNYPGGIQGIVADLRTENPDASYQPQTPGLRR